jgi:hypothetical protein
MHRLPLTRPLRRQACLSTEGKDVFDMTVIDPEATFAQPESSHRAWYCWSSTLRDHLLHGQI